LPQHEKLHEPASRSAGVDPSGGRASGLAVSWPVRPRCNDDGVIPGSLPE
jgi:hypothetical protein